MTRFFVTGGSGFIAAHIIDILVQAGHSVVFTVRSDAKGQNVLKNHPSLPKDKLSFVIVEDIAQEAAFDGALDGHDHEVILHTSSPFHFNVQDAKKDLLDPAINGTVGILKAAKKSAPSVKRVVILSSFASIIDATQGSRPGYTYSEKDWNPITAEQATESPSHGYRASKTLAEKAAWDFVEKEKPHFTLSTVCPPLVLGPIVPNLQDLDHLNTSNQRILNIIQGKSKSEIPDTGTFIWVDVRDLALANIRAGERDDAANKRFFVTAGKFSNKEIADIIRDNFPDLKENLPGKEVKSGDYPEGGLYGYDNSQSKQVLGLSYRSLKESIVDAVNSLKAEGA